MTLSVGSVCSGIEAASVAWNPLGWRTSFLSEIEAFPRAVLKHHYPAVPLHGDFTTIKAGEYEPIDLLVGGTPCQSFSVAGLRGGMADDRGNLALEYLRLADRLRPKWLVWENVPGVLSSAGGRDFGSFLGGLGQLGYGFAYRVLDAQYFGLAQRRKRVFVVGYLGDWRRAAAVLFEPASLRWHPAPSRDEREGTSFGPACGISPDCFDRSGEGANGTAGERSGLGVERDVAYAIRAKRPGGVAFNWQASRAQTTLGYDDGAGISGTLESNQVPAISIALRGRDGGATAEMGDDVAFTLRSSTGGGDKPHVLQSAVAFDLQQITSAAFASVVRRLTPRECERLQGFPDGYTAVPYRGKPAADGPRYKALGNSMAVPVMAWIGRRIAAVEAIRTSHRIAA